MKTFFTFFFILIFSPVVFAADEINDYSSDFSIEIIPNDPGPKEKVFAKIISYQFDVNRSNITWILNGKTIVSGLGEKTAEFETLNLSESTRLTVNITTDEGIQTSKSKTFSGSDIDFLWEALTTVPAGYKGKALPSYKSVVKITAMPHLFLNGALVSSSGLVYDWTLNYKKLPDFSGADKKTFSLKLSDYGEYIVGLTVSSKDKRASFQKYFRVSAENVEPAVILYDDDPMVGPIYGKALTSGIELKARNLSLRAESYYFASDNGVGLSYFWKMNDKKINPSRKPNTVSLAVGENTGSAEVSVEVKNSGEKMFQSAEKFLEIKF